MSHRELTALPKILPSVLRLLMMSSIVVLPAPLGPMTAHMSPEWIVPVACCITRVCVGGCWWVLKGLDIRGREN